MVECQVGVVCLEMPSDVKLNQTSQNLNILNIEHDKTKSSYLVVQDPRQDFMPQNPKREKGKTDGTPQQFRGLKSQHEF